MVNLKPSLVQWCKNDKLPCNESDALSLSTRELIYTLVSNFVESLQKHVDPAFILLPAPNQFGEHSPIFQHLAHARTRSSLQIWF